MTGSVGTYWARMFRRSVKAHCARAFRRSVDARCSLAWDFGILGLVELFCGLGGS